MISIGINRRRSSSIARICGSQAANTAVPGQPRSLRACRPSRHVIHAQARYAHPLSVCVTMRYVCSRHLHTFGGWRGWRYRDGLAIDGLVRLWVVRTGRLLGRRWWYVGPVGIIPGALPLYRVVARGWPRRGREPTRVRCPRRPWKMCCTDRRTGISRRWGRNIRHDVVHGPYCCCWRRRHGWRWERDLEWPRGIGP